MTEKRVSTGSFTIEGKIYNYSEYEKEGDTLRNVIVATGESSFSFQYDPFKENNLRRAIEKVINENGKSDTYFHQLNVKVLICCVSMLK